MKPVSLILVLLFLILPVAAQTPAKILVLPLNVAAGFDGDEDDRLTVALQKRLQQLAPKAEVQVARGAELTAYQYKADSEKPPGESQAATIARAYQARYVLWANIHFTPVYDAPTRCLSMGGAAHLWVYDLDRKLVFIDQPLSLLRSGPVKNIKNEGASRAQAQQLIAGCINDLAIQIVTIAEARLERARVAAAQVSAAPREPAFKPSNAYRQMERSFKEYQRALKANSFFDINASQQNLNSQWIQLNQAEQKKLAETYPGIVNQLNNPVWGGYAPYGGGSWPYYYPPPQRPIHFTP